ncbi:MAG TPA: FtsX-like permease family protein [Chryseolinea sp.]|nr:FtsX-like permease family protein [Chryseolinea sp.]
MKNQPPVFTKYILQLFCHAEYIEEVEGDLYELFQERLARRGIFNAQLNYALDVLRAISPYRPYPRRESLARSLPMREKFRHFFTIAMRNIIRSRTSSIINVAGLAISLAAFLLIALYLLDEMTFDSFHPKPEEVYRISYSFKSFDGNEGKDSRAAGLWSVKLKETMPEVKQITRFSRFGYPGNVWSGTPDHVFVESNFLWADPTYTEIFALPLVSGGDAKKILSDPQYVIINETIAHKYFGDTDPLGQSMTYMRDGMNFQLIVGAVMKNYPTNTHFKPDFIANAAALDPLWKRNGEDRINSWGDSFSYSFIRLTPGADLAKVSQALQKIFNENLGERASTTHPVLVPLRDIHFTKGLLFELEAPGDTIHLYIFGSIGLLILSMTCINYMNLATARSIRRAKEVGLRKTLGVSKSSLVGQFLGESFLMTTIALVIALVLFILFLPSFNALTSKNFGLHNLVEVKSLYLIFGVAITVAIVSGSYPAFYLSAFKPLEVLKGTITIGKGPAHFRKVLVVVQISITLLLLTGTYVIHDQLAFIDHTKLSEFKDQIITVRLGGIVDNDKIPNFKQIARQDPRVKEISTGPHLPRNENFGNMSRSFEFKEVKEGNFSFEQLDIDLDFTTMFHLEFVAGRDFSVDNPADSSAIVINEQALKTLGVTPEKALGLQAEVITYYEIKGQMVAVKSVYQVIGVVKDFNYASLHKAIGPVALHANPKGGEMMYVKLSGTEYPQVIAALWDNWKKIYTATPFQYWFMDEEFGRLYKAERQMAQMLSYLAGMAIFIACLGLFGLASFTAEQKTKEIGIRKVMGASTTQVLMLLTSRYVKLTLIALLLGIPIAFLVIRSWMQTFEYKVEIGYGIYIWSCALILAVTIFTVAIESLRAARANPADSMRHE